jgi:mannose-6-phosphate isomerase-like protein (cupin superfamily)
MVLPLKEYLAKLPLEATQKWPEGVWDIEAFRHGTMSVILYTPHGKDYQTPHDQDELYIVVKGEGELLVEDKVHAFKAGDVLFVPAGKQHRFENFSEDIITWAVFWGPKGGEKK